MAQDPTLRGEPAELQKAADDPVMVAHLQAPPTFQKPKRIHPRRTLPLIREGAERNFHSTWREASYLAPRGLEAPTLDASQDLALFTNTALTQPSAQRTASNVGEPSVAMNGSVVFYTGNWYAAMSSDGGKNFQYIDPASAFAASDPPNSHFCCDQIVNYIPSIDTFVWLLQYGPDTGDNIQRLAFAKTDEVVQGKWRLFDITTASLGVPGAFLDFPDLAVGANCLYATTNIFQVNGTGSGVVRIPFAGIANGQVAAQRFVSMDYQSFRVAQNVGLTAYFAAHQDTSTLAVFSWNEGADTPAHSSVGVARWIGGNGYRSVCKDGNRWLDRADPRITGATHRGGELWFSWGVDQQSNHRTAPFIQIAQINAADLTLIDNINVFDPDSATCYAGLATNAQNEIGITYMIGGGPRNPSHVIGILTGSRKDIVVSTGDRGPQPDPHDGKGQWGDYITIRPAFPDQRNFAATGFTMLGPADTSNRDVTPRFVVFGRSGANSPTPDPGITADGADSNVGIGPGAVTNVNDLRIVKDAVATTIKRACGILMSQLAPKAFPVFEDVEAAAKPGVERWPVKTGQDPDRAAVGKNVINGVDLGAGIVSATVEELISAPRPADMANVFTLVPAYQTHRAAPVETTIWQIEGTITAMKSEADGDYHLVIQGASGETIIGEIPTPTTQFIGDSPWLANIRSARRAVDEKFVSHLSPADFVPLAGKLVPREAFTNPSQAAPGMVASFASLANSGLQPMLPFKTQLPATRTRITGVGFFDKVHGQMGVSQANGIELHPILKIEWL
jgi:hypothetical protein